MTTEKIDILLAKYFGGNASINELEQLEQWIAENKDNETYFENLTTIFEQSLTPQTPYRKPNAEKALQQFSDYIDGLEEGKPIDNSARQSVSRAKKLNRSRLMAVAASVAILITASVFFYTNKSDDVKQFTATSNLHEHTMPDNTIIELEVGSYVVYDKGYGKTNRQVELVGKARFTIGDNNAKHKLIVQADETFIEDIGTVFTLEAYPNAEVVKVSVSEGEVLFYSKKDKGVSILKDEAAIYNKIKKQFEKELANQTNESLKSYYFAFNSTPISDVIDQLSEHYNVNIIVKDKNIDNERISVIFDNEDIDTILSIIAETLNLRVKKEGNMYLLSY